MPAVGQVRDGVEVEVDGLARGAVAAHPVLRVALVAREPRRDDLGGVEQQRDLAVAEAVRREKLELVGEPERELVAADHGVHVAHALEVVGGERRRGLGDERLAEGGDRVAPQPQAAGGAMPAEA